MKHRRATMKDCQQCGEPPECSTAPEPCNIQIQPEFKVRDTVKWYEDSEHVTIGGIWEKNACLLYNNGTFIVKPLSDLTLVTPAPETHVFGGIVLSRRGSHPDDYVLPMGGIQSVLFKLLQEDEAAIYTMTFAKEKVS